MLQCSFLFISKEIITFMTSCKLVIGRASTMQNIWMSTALWSISGNVQYFTLPKINFTITECARTTLRV